ncbi:MAG: hypothetical protein JWM99_4520 [Verrucomicrobiales bacterium]|nr:hypothetical protein [Verrucomicrobiales bacterium]
MHSPFAKDLSLGTVLLVDDVPANLALLSAALEPEGYEILAASTGAAALNIAAKAQPGLILLDVLMPDLDGFETCRRLKAQASTRDIPVIFITARNEMDAVVAAFRAGGVDYVTKPFQTEEVLRRVETHLRLAGLNRELREKNRALERRTAELTAEIQRRENAETALVQADHRLTVFSDLEATRGNIMGLVGESPPLKQLLEEINRLRDFANTSVLILGESGTGKELIARAIHFDSARARAPFVPINCVAIPAELAESVLFGHVKGAFTGAIADRHGCFALADGGTLFLDEIGDMPMALQVKLLRVLEDGRVTPVGGAEPRKVEVRVIAATNANLAARIEAGTFREDLYFRLARYTISAPPLRDRRADVLRLSEHFLAAFASEMGKRPPVLSDEAIASLRHYRFPGNVRELKNIIERALIESGGKTIEPGHFHLPMQIESRSTVASVPLKGGSLGSLPLNLADAEEVLIQRALDETQGNIAEAARLLGVNRTRIYRKLAQIESPTS